MQRCNQKTPLIGSCNLLGIAPYKYFEYILPRLHGSMTNEEYEELLPYKVVEKISQGQTISL